MDFPAFAKVTFCNIGANFIYRLRRRSPGPNRTRCSGRAEAEIRKGPEFSRADFLEFFERNPIGSIVATYPASAVRGRDLSLRAFLLA